MAKQELLKDGTDSLRLGLSEYGRAVVPSSCSIRILHEGEVLESGAATSGIYTPGTATVGELRQDIVAEWTYIVDGVTKKHVELFDVVLFKLYPIASEAELFREAPSLLNAESVYHGTMASASATGLVDSGLIGSREDYEGSVLVIKSGTDINGQYVITAFSAVTGAVTYPAAKTAAAADTFIIRKSFQYALDAAWADIYDRLIQQCAAAPGGLHDQAARPYLIMTPDRLRRPHILKALEIIFRGLADDANGGDWARAEHYLKEFDSAWSGLSLVFAYHLDDTPVPETQGSAQWGFGR